MIKTTPLVSVIVPVYNHSAFLTQRLNSVFNQSFKDFEVIILDDYSSENTKDIIENYRDNPHVSHVIYNSINSGSTFKQWEKGIVLAKGKLLWIAESDDFADENFLQEAVNELNKVDVDLVFFKSSRVDATGKVLDELEWWYKDLSETRWKQGYTAKCADEITQYLIRKCTIVNASAVVFRKRNNLMQVLSEIQNFSKAGDWLFWLSYLNTGANISYLTSSSNYFRYHDNTTRSTIPYSRNIEILKIYKWVCLNIYKRESWNLITYYLNTHIYLFPRRQFQANSKLIIEALRYSKLFGFAVIFYYLKAGLHSGKKIK